ncbi:hypothetical protein COY23_02505 [bacterium (Candidatus Torokbacteria) CG_4_10_14_0_2_um_filter_35_8]|nr:MAG: hypothetical protein COY23_02505 [bacterium (Candidatus Torokbacteria) CG_4_10_14_0_2_um_filter_35_8]
MGLSKGFKKYIRRRKAEIRREFWDPEKIKEEIEKLCENLEIGIKGQGLVKISLKINNKKH